VKPFKILKNAFKSKNKKKKNTKNKKLSMFIKICFEPRHTSEAQKREKLRNEIGTAGLQGFDQVALQNNFHLIFLMFAPPLILAAGAF
jgi:hypothetical protein